MALKQQPWSLPLDVINLVCQASDHQGLHALQHVNAAWRHFSLPQLWRSIDIGEWENCSSAHTIHSIYGRYVQILECRRHSRRRRHSSERHSPSPEIFLGAKTRTEVLSEWLGLRWPLVRRVIISAWPPYNVSRVQMSAATACPQLQVLVLEGAAATWLASMQRAVTMHPTLTEFHVTEDMRALLAPAADDLRARRCVNFNFLAEQCRPALTHLTLPCMADSAVDLLAQLSRLLPALLSLHLRQIDAGVATRLHISVPPLLQVLQTSGQHPLSARMFSQPPALQDAAGHLNMAESFCHLRKLSVTGSRSEEAAQHEFKRFWSVIFRSKWTKLEHLAVPVVCAGLAPLIEKQCPGLLNLRIAHAGCFINPLLNVEWVSHLTQLSCLRHLDVASSNNQFDGCRLSAQLATDVTWRTHSLHTLYLSRLSLTTEALHSLLLMLPQLQTLWFTFDTSRQSLQTQRAPLLQCQLRYLIIHKLCESSGSARSASPESEDIMNRLGPLDSTVALTDCLLQVPLLKQCRLPMFTFPDTERRWLQCMFPHIDFRKYAPPY